MVIWVGRRKIATLVSALLLVVTLGPFVTSAPLTHSPRQTSPENEMITTAKIDRAVIEEIERRELGDTVTVWIDLEEVDPGHIQVIEALGAEVRIKEGLIFAYAPSETVAKIAELSFVKHIALERGESSGSPAETQNNWIEVDRGRDYLVYRNTLAGEHKQTIYSGPIYTQAHGIMNLSTFQDLDNVIWLFWSSNDGGEFSINEVRYTTSGWSKPREVVSSPDDSRVPGPCYPNGFQSPDGTIYLFFQYNFGETQNINEIHCLKFNKESGWSGKYYLGTGNRPSALQDRDGMIHIFCHRPSMIAGEPSMAEYIHDGENWIYGEISNSVQDPSAPCYPSAFQARDGTIWLFYSVPRESKKIYLQTKSIGGNWSEPVKIAMGWEPSSFQSSDGVIHLFFCKGDNIYEMAKPPDGNWSNPTKATEGSHPSAFEDSEGAIRLFFSLNGSIYEMKKIGSEWEESSRVEGYSQENEQAPTLVWPWISIGAAICIGIFMAYVWKKLGRK